MKTLYSLYCFCLLLQSMFEVLTSETSYLRSLRVLTDHFHESRNLEETMVIRDKKTLFSSILRVREVSERWEGAAGRMQADQGKEENLVNELNNWKVADTQIASKQEMRCQSKHQSLSDTTGS